MDTYGFSGSTRTPDPDPDIVNKEYNNRYAKLACTCSCCSNKRVFFGSISRVKTTPPRKCTSIHFPAGFHISQIRRYCVDRTVFRETLKRVYIKLVLPLTSYVHTSSISSGAYSSFLPQLFLWIHI